MKSSEVDIPKNIRTLGELKSSGYQSQSVKDEMRANLLSMLREGKRLFEGIRGYDETVLPAIERAVLARHNINFLGLRGQAKTRIARSMIHLLDAYIPIIEGSEINDDPLKPMSRLGRELVAEMGDQTPIQWLHRTERYTEKLATPDVTVADLIGDTDPIKAANLKLPYSDERVLHFGLIPRAHRGIFVINELPDLQPRIQVALFNILQEGDIQIRGFKLRLPLDVQFVFTANPEDYTNRGAIITPLKDRIQSQITTHYPHSVELSREITVQEARLATTQTEQIQIPELLSTLVEQVAFEARRSELVDQKSGVSARLTISAYEMLVSAVERRMVRNGESSGIGRMADLLAIVPAITGKVELVYEGEQEGPQGVAHTLLEKAIRTLFAQYFPDPEVVKKRKNEINPYGQIIEWFSSHEVEVPANLDQPTYIALLKEIPKLEALTKQYQKGLAQEEIPVFMEFILHGLAAYSQLGKHLLNEGLAFTDLFSSVFQPDDEDENG